MSLPFSIRLPLEGAFRSLGADVTAKYTEVAGGSPEHAQALVGSVTAATAALADGAGADAVVDLAFATGASGIEVTVRCGAKSTVVRQALTPPA